MNNLYRWIVNKLWLGTVFITLLTFATLSFPSAVFANTLSNAQCEKEVSQQGRNEPKFVGLEGYIRLEPSWTPDNYMRKLPSINWHIKSLVSIGPKTLSSEGEKIPAKTRVKVLSQNLTHEGGGFYPGYLTVQLDDGQIKLIDQKYFSPVAWWKCNINNAVKYSPIIALADQDAKPINGRDGSWETLGKERKVFCTRTQEKHIDDFEDGVLCYVYKKWLVGYGGVGLVFSASELKFVY